MKKFYILLAVISIILSGCGKDNEPDDSYSDDAIVQGPDEFITDELIRVNNLLYKINKEDMTCTLVSSSESWSMGHYIYYYSSFPHPVFDIPDKVSLKGNTYQVTNVNLYVDDVPYREDTYISEVKYLSIPSSVLSYSGTSRFNLKSLSVGANVRHIGYVYAQKIFWLPNTPPSGYLKDSYYGSIEYASTSTYGKNVIVYPHLSSMFTADGISYVMTDPAERKCDLIGVVAPSKDNIKCNGSVMKDGIIFKIENILPYAFCGCENITEVSVSNINNIENCAFSTCTNLGNALLDSIVTLGDKCFERCAITKISIPGTVSTIGEAAFKDCENLLEVTFQDGARELRLERPSNSNYTILDFNIFSGTKVKKLYIGRDLNYSTYNDRSPFYRMNELEEVEIHQGETEISNSMFYGCIALKTVIIGDDITKIGSKAFSGCSSMTSFKFGSKLKTIGEDAFSDCTALISFTSEAITPPTCGKQALDDINKWNCTLYVPDESLDLYKKADQWKNFLKIE